MAGNSRQLPRLFPALVLLVAMYYLWTVSPCSTWHEQCAPSFLEDTSGQRIGPYNALAKAFLSGQVSLPVQPDPHLLQLPDPYDPRQNVAWRMGLHDLALRGGKLYLPFGPPPALLLFAPVQALTGAYLPDAWGVGILAIASFTAACLALRLLLRALFPDLPAWIGLSLCLGLGFCNVYPFLLRRPAMYETAILGGQAFLMLATWLFSRVVLAARPHPLRDALLGGMMLALAFASRPPLLLAAAVLLSVLLICPLPAGRPKVLAAAAGPLMLGGALCAWYNYIRFGSPFEIGYHYQLSALDVHAFRLFLPQRIPSDLYLFFLSPPVLSSVFPFLQTRLNTPSPGSEAFAEPIIGMLWLCPILLVLALAPLVLRRWRAERLRAIWLAGLLLSGVVQLLVDSGLGVSMRYLADFSTMFYLSASLMVAWLLVSGPPRLRNAAPFLLAALVSVGILCNAAIGMTGYYDSFQHADPADYQAIASLFQPVSHALAALGVPP